MNTQGTSVAQGHYGTVYPIVRRGVLAAIFGLFGGTQNTQASIIDTSSHRTAHKGWSARTVSVSTRGNLPVVVAEFLGPGTPQIGDVSSTDQWHWFELARGLFPESRDLTPNERDAYREVRRRLFTILD